MEHRAGSGVPVRPPLLLPSSCSPSWAIMNKQCPLPSPPLPPKRFLILSFILSSVCLHPSAVASCPICSADADFENVLFQGWCQRTSIARGVVGMTYGEKGDRKWRVRQETHVLWWGVWVNFRDRRPAVASFRQRWVETEQQMSDYNNGCLCGNLMPEFKCTKIRNRQSVSLSRHFWRQALSNLSNAGLNWMNTGS